MSDGMLVLACALIATAFASAVATIVFFRSELAKYKSAFRDVATQLYNVTADRNKLSIANEGLKREVARECVKSERLSENLSDLRDAIEEKYNTELTPLVERVTTLKSEHRE